MSGKHNLQKTAKKLNVKKANKTISYPAVLGIPVTKVVEVPGRSGYHYARVRGNMSEIVQVHNSVTNPIYDYPVMITFKNNRWEVEEVNWGRYNTWGTSANTNIGKHGESHSLWAYDPVYITTRQIVDGLIYASATGTAIHLNQGLIEYKGSISFIDDQEFDLANYLPTGTGAIWAIIRSDSLGTISVQNDMPYVENITQLNYSNIPNIDKNYIGLAAVKLYYGQTSLDRRAYTSDVIDLRYLPNYGNTSTGTVSSNDYSACQGRLTLVSGTAIPTYDITGSSMLWLCPDMGNAIGLYAGGDWDIYTFSHPSLASSGLVTGTNYDIFAYYDAEVKLESLAWSNATTRATALISQNGVLVKSGDSTRRYLGMVRTRDEAKEFTDTILEKYVQNYYNRTLRTMRVADATGHNYDVAAYRSWNADDAIRIKFVIGLVEERINLRLWGDLTPGTDARRALVSIGYDVNNNFLGVYNSIIEVGCAQRMRIATTTSHLPDIGHHYYQITENAASGTEVAFNNAEMEADIYG